MSDIKTNIRKLSQKKPEEILLDGGYVEMDKLESALHQSQSSHKILEDVLLEEGVIDEQTLSYALSSQLQIPYIELDQHDITEELIQENKSHMIKYQFVPLDKFDNILTILIGNTLTAAQVDGLVADTAREVFAFVGNISQIRETLDKYVSQEEREAVHTEVIGDSGDVTAGWESIFEMADQAVQDELKEKASGFFGDESGFEEMDFGQGGGTEGYYEEGAAPEGYESLEKTQETYEDIPQEDYIEGPGDSSDSEEKAEMDKLAEHLKDDPFDYDAVNRYVELALGVGDMESAIAQLMSFAQGLDQAGDHEGAVNCFQYILDLDPNNEEAKKRLKK